MNMLFSGQWKKASRRADAQGEDWMYQPLSGVGRLLASIAIIGIAVIMLDHAAATRGQADTRIAASQQGSWK